MPVIIPGIARGRTMRRIVCHLLAPQAYEPSRIELGTAVVPLAWAEWMRAERALRQARPLPGALSAVLLAAVVVTVGLLVLAGVLWR